MSRQQFLNVSQALFIIASQLSYQGLQNVKQAREISRREKIEEDLQIAHEKIARAEKELREQIDEICHANLHARHQEQQYQALVMHMSDGHAVREMITDGGVVTDYRFIDVNQAFEELLGKNRDQIVGMTGSAVYNTTPPPLLELYTNVHKTGKPAIRVIRHPILQCDMRISVFSPYDGVVSTIISRL